MQPKLIFSDWKGEGSVTIMDDSHIIDLFFRRSEEAIAATASKFGAYCYAIAYRILREQRDSEEAVSDTYLDAWNAMPPHRPASLQAFLGRITRRNALDRWDYLHAEKRGGGEVPLVLEELQGCLTGGTDPGLVLEQKELGSLLNSFVRSLPGEEQRVFVRRYWYLEPVKEIADRYGYSQSKVKSMLLRMRGKLRTYLEKEGIRV